MRALSALLTLATCIAVSACGGPPAKEPAKREPPTQKAKREPRKERSTTAPRTTGGSSDGVTCEQARDQNVEELSMGKKGEADLSHEELSAVLNKGTYVSECDVPATSKVDVCAAVKNGGVVGVTVALSPSDPELEKCVAAKVRALAFPSSGKMDVLRTHFE